MRELDIVLVALLVSAAGLTALQQKRRQPIPTRTILTVLGLSSLLSCGYAAFAAYQVMTLQPPTVSIKTTGVVLSGEAKFGVYWDVTGSRPVKEIAWGTLEPGKVGNATFYVKNEASSEIYCAVTWIEEAWQPAGASQYFDLTCDFGDKPLKPNRARKVTLQLHVNQNIVDVKEFSFDMVITAKGEPFTG